MVIRHNSVVIDRQARTIAVGDRVRYFPDMAPRTGPRKSYAAGNGTYFFDVICHLALNGWTRKQDLFDFVFSANADGGPNGGLQTFDVRRVQWRPKLASLGLAIVHEKRGGVVWYKLVETDTL